jgi:NAD(P)H-hydrate epimerase
VAVEATVTVAFHAPKLGHRIAPGKGLTGELRVAAIGIPDGAPASPAGGLIGAGVLESLPRREPGSTKFSSGEVLVVGGSRGLTGAVCMAAEAAIRCGAGYAAVAVPEDLEPIFETKLTEVMSHGFGGAPGRLAASDADGIAATAERAAAVVLGPGLGRDGASAALARSLPDRIAAPLVIDADGLNAHAGEIDSLADRQAPTVLTPHAGELGRLLERDSAAIEARRLDSAREAALRSGAIVVLKGDDTLVARGERIAVAPGGSPALATAGTGDVLAGAIAALLARGTEPWQAVCAGVMAQQRAGRIAALLIGSAESVIAGDVIAALPEALAGRSDSSPSDGRRAS